MQASELKGHLENIEGDGFTILEDVVPLDLVTALKDRIRKVEAESIRPPEELEGDDRFGAVFEVV